MIRSVLSVLAAFVVSTIAVLLVELVSSALFAVPEGLGSADPEQAAALMAEIPTGALLLVGLAHGLGALLGALTGARLGGRGPALVFAVLFTLATVSNLVAIPHAVWFVAYDLVFVAAGLGAGLALGLPSPTSAETTEP